MRLLIFFSKGSKVAWEYRRTHLKRHSSSESAQIKNFPKSYRLGRLSFFSFPPVDMLGFSCDILKEVQILFQKRCKIALEYWGEGIRIIVLARTRKSRNFFEILSGSGGYVSVS